MSATKMDPRLHNVSTIVVALSMHHPSGRALPPLAFLLLQEQDAEASDKEYDDTGVHRERVVYDKQRPAEHWRDHTPTIEETR